MISLYMTGTTGAVCLLMGGGLWHCIVPLGCLRFKLRDFLKSIAPQKQKAPMSGKITTAIMITL